LKGDAVKQADEALRAGAQVVQRVGCEGYSTEGANAARAILAFEVAFEDNPAVSRNDEAVDVPNPLLGNCLIEQRPEISCEALVCRRGRQQPTCLGGIRAEGLLHHHQHSCSDERLTAAQTLGNRRK
jgi:hypothetical protein